MIRTLLSLLASKLPPPRIIFDRAGVSPYLSRWYLLGRPTMPDGSHPFTEDGSPKEGILDPDRLFAVFLHKFHRGDDDAELHNHPWKWAVALVLSGGYREERRRGAPERGGAVSIRTVFPWTLNLIHHDTFHRVDLLEKDAWSLFLAGPREKGWGFWNRSTGRYMPWMDFITWRRDPTAFLQEQARRGEPTSPEGRWWASVVERARQQKMQKILDDVRKAIPYRPDPGPTRTNTFHAIPPVGAEVELVAKEKPMAALFMTRDVRVGDRGRVVRLVHHQIEGAPLDRPAPPTLVQVLFEEQDHVIAFDPQCLRVVPKADAVDDALQEYGRRTMANEERWWAESERVDWRRDPTAFRQEWRRLLDDARASTPYQADPWQPAREGDRFLSVTHRRVASEVTSLLPYEGGCVLRGDGEALLPARRYPNGKVLVSEASSSQYNTFYANARARQWQRCVQCSGELGKSPSPILVPADEPSGYRIVSWFCETCSREADAPQGEPLVEVDLYAWKKRCEDDDCFFCDAVVKRAESGLEASHRSLILR